MTRSRVLIVALGLIMLAAQVSGSKRRVKVDAAVAYSDGFVVLFADDEVVRMQDNKEIDLKSTIEMGVPPRMKLQAAVMDDAFTKLFLYGPKAGYRVHLTKRQGRNLRYGPLKKFFRDNCGPDAAVRRGDVVYFFKGCEMVRRGVRNDWGDPEDVTGLNLPCNPDAAWNTDDGNAAVILRGDQIWLWDKDNVVTGPNDFNSMYTIESWELAPYDEEW